MSVDTGAMNKAYWVRRELQAKHNLMGYAIQLERAIVSADEKSVEVAIAGINYAHTIRKIAAYEIAEIDKLEEQNERRRRIFDTRPVPGHRRTTGQ
jgi:hypothetical protein